jgi:hypothetical protein
MTGLQFIESLFGIAALLILLVFGLLAKWTWDGIVRRK